MNSVNDLIPEWETGASVKTINEVADDRAKAEQLRGIARTAWHPVSVPPAEADSQTQEPGGAVLAYWNDGQVTMEDWEDVANRRYPDMAYWARVRDVVLMPPTDHPIEDPDKPDQDTIAPDFDYVRESYNPPGDQ